MKSLNVKILWVADQVEDNYDRTRTVINDGGGNNR